MPERKRDKLGDKQKKHRTNISRKHNESKLELICSAQKDGEYIITLPLGGIKGRESKTIYDQKFFSFEGIPYAQPPLGELRFRAPAQVEPWKGIKDCTKCASKPLQLNPVNESIEGSEDCLYLNVYAKRLSSEKPLPVLVFIPGGSFRAGGARRETLGPDYFMNEDVVLVTFNYRLCALGFLSLADPSLSIPGNAGLKDQVLALKWIKQFISHFNGDPKNVTVFGSSAGAASTHLLMLSEQARDLFKRAIAMSGCALNYWVNMPQTNMAYRLAKFHGYNGDNIDAKVLQFLNMLDPTKLVVHSLLNKDEQRKSYMFPFGPIVEPYIEEGCIIPERPFNMLKNAWSNKISMMIGGTSFEGLFMYSTLKRNPDIMKLLYNEPALILPEDVYNSNTTKENKRMGEQLLKLHFGEKEPNDHSLLHYLDIYSYKIFWHDFHRTILARLSFALAPTFLYRFGFDSPDFNPNRRRYSDEKVRGVSHGDDLCYLFHARDSRKLYPNSAEYKTIKRMISMWTTYATTGDPDSQTTDPIIWDAVTKYYNLRGVNIGQHLEFKTIPEIDKLEAWAKLYKSPEQLCGAHKVEDYNWGDPLPTI
ncbi:PREDICTED: esterase B1-like isoform X1 [Bactrocera latifrons]|uniref:esterase B1-like isoform X1 n=1 Tax=Bactrocera latifrons TaxID=174628 RepID=UPI0008DCEC2B|nr:PREDICTED: esterase B1-like isoform X1 [Bactrocera latifrons]XP_018796274.1 PREDICTED: esterase B1-like isoform X1 [Bactrocera latifrons]XP_018796275.1 PREDICTED: esterase B1-like isoform X1 [Bactrocera latifrons]